jgi:hypothetical protein
MVFASCSADKAKEPASAADGPTVAHVTFGEQIAQIRGHHLVAVKLYKSGEGKLAAVHTGHPVAELLAAVKSEIAEHDEGLAGRLESALEAASDAVADGDPPAKLETAVERAAGIGRAAEKAVVGTERGTRYTASVVAALTSTVGREYEEALKDGTIDLLPEYQDAHGFTQIAKELYSGIADEVRRAGAHQADEIDDDFKTLEGALPDVTPPAEPAALTDVQRAGTHIGAELKETVHALLLESVDADETFARIDELLTEIVETYEAGDHEQAAELAAEAYLENYEHVEGDVKELAPEVNADLEPLLGAQLRAKIREGVSTKELKAIVARARVLLKDAKSAVSAKDEHR